MGELNVRHILVALLIFGAFSGLAWLFHVFLVRAARRLAQKTKTGLYGAIISSLEKPVVAIIILAGLSLSTRLLPLEPIFYFYVSEGLSIVLGLLGAYAVAALLYALAGWYRREAMADRGTGLTRRLLRLFQVVTILVAALLGVLVTLANLGVETAPVTGWMAGHGWRIALILVLCTIAALAIGRLIPKLIVATVARRAGESKEEVRKRADTLSRVLVNVGQVVVLFIAFFMVLSELEIDIAPFLAGVGVAGIAIGFGAQSLIKDLLAGLFIILENQYHVGDVVRIADVAGLVEDINLRRTVLRDLDGIVHIVPNGEIRVASHFTLGLISGRALADLKDKVGISGIIYAGNHGLEIEGPGIRFVNPVAEELRPILRVMHYVLSRALGTIKGVFVENKGLSLSIHYRLVEERRAREVERVVKQVVGGAQAAGKAKITSGKKVYEVRPAVTWDKGKTIKLLMKKYGKGGRKSGLLPMYFGDDLTDEDGFRVIENYGVGLSVFVGEQGQQSVARYYLKSPAEVATFLGILLEQARKGFR